MNFLNGALNRKTKIATRKTKFHTDHIPLEVVQTAACILLYTFL